MTRELEPFNPLIRRWFETSFGRATDVQARAWPRIARGENLLITAPTGSGKTLTAFLWAINRFVSGTLETGSTRILYISPLKALNNDIQRNLISPLSELQALFAEEGVDFPQIRVQTRSGDTDSGDRRRMLRHPPEILITTPESLNLLLSSQGGQTLLQNLDTVILDEIHGVIGTKRGSWLMSGVERLVPLSGEFQRIALSATVRPLDVVAHQVGGYRQDGDSDTWLTRPVSIIEAKAEKSLAVSVHFPDEARNRTEDDNLWDLLARDIHEHIRQNRSTLMFVNSRALCEKITWKLNQVAGDTVAWAHHGSLSREIRTDVEQRLKQGKLAAIVATSSLEMGIDIGSLDEVILIQSPSSVSSAIQRVGRAGHSIGETSRATIYPSDPRDFIEAAVLARAILAGDIESLRPVDCPLDVLAQIIVSMTGTAQWNTEDLFDELRRSTPFHNLNEQHYRLVLDMLAGRYADQHIRELRPKIDFDRVNDTVRARKGALMSLYLSGGVIPDRGYYQLRHEESNARIGELDEEFVWEAKIGQVFSLGTQRWQVRKITHNDVIVAPARSSEAAPPFWKAESIQRDFHFASRVGEFLEDANDRLEDDAFRARLISEYFAEPTVADEILAFLRQQRALGDIPHRHHLLVERVQTAPGGVQGHQAILHTNWGSRVNRPLAMALEAAWQNRFGELPDIYVSNECLVVQLAHDISADDLLDLVPSSRIETLLRQRLEASGFFAARFRENAGRALLLSRGRFNERKPLWMSRLQSRKLMDSVLKFDDFPILLETWRTCLRDEFDIDNLKQVLAEVENGTIAVSEIETATPGPFARSIAWGQINQYMYLTDQAVSGRASGLRRDLLEEIVFEPDLRPAIPANVTADFLARRQRLLPGYGPEDLNEAVEWVKERSALPISEWRNLTELKADDSDLLTTIPGGAEPLVIAREDVSLLKSLNDDDGNLAVFLGNWLQYYGPLTVGQIHEKLGVDVSRLVPALDELEEDRVIVRGHLVQGNDEIHWCDAANFEVLLRMLRQGSRTDFETLPGDALPLFLRNWQARGPGADRLHRVLEQLRCYSCRADLWEKELLPSRIAGYHGGMLDQVFQETMISWVGTGEKTITLSFRDDLDLLFDTPPETPPTIEQLLPDGRARYDFGSLMDHSGLSASVLADTLWKWAWHAHVTNDSFVALRRGIETGFTLPELKDSGDRRSTRRSLRRWSIPFAGNWHRLDHPPAPEEGIEQEELNRDRIRILLDRYGIVFREIVARELPVFHWSRIFRSLRLMELSGEVWSGHFFANVPGPQFISPEAFRFLTRGLQHDEIFWINATDPASPSGSNLEFSYDLPRREPSAHLVYHGQRLVVTSQRNGKTLTIRVPPDDDNLPRYLEVLKHLGNRSFQPVGKITIETINGDPARQSEYLGLLKDRFNALTDYKDVYIQRQV